MDAPKGQPRREDRLSSLPDEILHHIFNFLTAKHAARTCVLSRRWARVWSSCPNLHFDELDFPLSVQGVAGKFCHRRFMNFADRFILLSDASNLNCFSVAAREGTDMSRVVSWMYIAIKRNVRDLAIYSEQKEPVKLPPRIFHLRSLKRLSLTVFHNQTLHWPRPHASAATLVALEELTLRGFRFVDTERDAISLSCPDLKIWKMGRCTGLFQLDVTCPGLEIFCVDRCKGLLDLVVLGPSLATITISDTFIRAEAATSFEILAPKLCEFVWLDKPVDRYKSSKMSPSRTDLRLKCLWGRAFLISLNETRHLTIDCISVWSCMIEGPLFDSLYQNLEVLQLLVDSNMANIAVAMYKSLGCFRNVKTLDIRNMKLHEENNINEHLFKSSIGLKAQDFTKHQLPYLGELRKVVYNDFTGASWEVEYIRRILGVAPKLRMMTITPSNSDLTHNFSMIAEELQKLAAASPHVKLIFKQPRHLLATSRRPSIIH